MRAGGDEVWGYVSESEDTGGDRLYVNEETCLEYLKRHLQHSSLYRCSEVEALDHMATCELKAEIETEETRVQIREEYKAHTEQEAKKKRAREAEEKEAIAKKRYTEKEEDWQTSWQKGSQKRSHHDDSTCSSDGAAERVRPPTSAGRHRHVLRLWRAT